MKLLIRWICLLTGRPVFLMDADAKPKEVLLLNRMLKKGINAVSLSKTERQPGTRMVLFIDGQLEGVIE